MRTLLQALHELVEPRLIQTGPLELREDDANSTCPTTRLERSGQSLALRLGPWLYSSELTIPANRWLFPLFRTSLESPPLCRSCDYILFNAPKPHELFILLCELKSGRARSTAPQLRNSKLLADHILSATRLHGEVAIWPTRLEYRGLVFAGDAPKQRQDTGAPGAYDYRDDERMPNLRILHLRAGRSYPLAPFCR